MAKGAGTPVPCNRPETMVDDPAGSESEKEDVLFSTLPQMESSACVLLIRPLRCVRMRVAVRLRAPQSVGSRAAGMTYALRFEEVEPPCKGWLVWHK